MKQMSALQNAKTPKLRIGFGFMKKDIVFTVAFTLALVSSAFHLPKLDYINFRVLISLANLMLALKAFEQLRLLDRMAVTLLNHCRDTRMVSAILVMLSFLSSMFVTNDVALITFVPLTLVIGKIAEIAKAETVILQTMAANIGSSLTPMGNPQNLFIFSYFRLGTLEFFLAVGSFVLLGFVMLAVFVFRLEHKELKIDLPMYSLDDRKKAAVWGIVFAVIIASILGVINYKIAFIVVLLTVFIFDRMLLLKIDYLLLFTFISFFIFIGNLSHFDQVQAFVKHVLNNSTSVYFSSIFLSQVISNVPASILLAKFTSDWHSLLLGVNIGGLGTLIASLASLISYKLFSSLNPQETKAYLVKFSFYNFGFLAVLCIVQYLFFWRS